MEIKRPGLRLKDALPALTQQPSQQVRMVKHRAVFPSVVNALPTVSLHAVRFVPPA